MGFISTGRDGPPTFKIGNLQCNLYHLILMAGIGALSILALTAAVVWHHPQLAAYLAVAGVVSGMTVSFYMFGAGIVKTIGALIVAGTVFAIMMLNQRTLKEAVIAAAVVFAVEALQIQLRPFKHAFMSAIKANPKDTDLGPDKVAGPAVALLLRRLRGSNIRAT